jgi:hypothetical protein
VVFGEECERYHVVFFAQLPRARCTFGELRLSGCGIVTSVPAQLARSAVHRKNQPAMRRLAHLAALFFLAVLLAASASAQKLSPMKMSGTEASLPHDQHAGITVSAAPVNDASRAKHIFGKANPLPAGILPVEVFLRNDTRVPVQIGLDTIQLEIHHPSGRMDGIDSLAPGQVASAIVHPHGPGAPRERRFPIGMAPISDKKVAKLTGLLQPLALSSDIVPPMGSIHGYLFFDLRHDFSAVDRSSLYIPDAMVIPSKTPLIFFEVSFARSDGQPPNRSR